MRSRGTRSLPRRRSRPRCEGSSDGGLRMTATDATPVEVPDIGDFTDVPIIEILVSPGDTVSAEDPLVTLESDKATMDVPAPFAGTVKQLQVQVGDRVSEGSQLLTLEPADQGDDSGAQPAAEADRAEPEADDGGESDEPKRRGEPDEPKRPRPEAEERSEREPEESDAGQRGGSAQSDGARARAARP